jgi:putative transposase
MPNYRRHTVSGGSYFFTVVTNNRAKILLSDVARKVLREAIKDCQERWPFDIDAFVLLDDHLHTIWTLPEGDSNFTLRWGYIKKEFSKRYLDVGSDEPLRSDSRQHRRERGFWQRRFWEHTLRDERDVERHLDYIHYNPVKHGLVSCPKDYPYSSFHRYQKEGVYDLNWGCLEPELNDLEVGE